MKLLSYRAHGQHGYGVLQDGKIWTLNPHFPQAPDLKSFIEKNLLAAAQHVPRQHEPDATLSEVTLELPIAHPGKILCVGVNYGGREAEYDDARQAPYPSLFMRTPESLVPHGGAVVIPQESAQLDYEGEIVLVIGRGGRRIPEEEAMAHVFGYTLMNEGSVRDWLRHGKFNVTQGKNFDRSGAVGPYVVTRDEVSDPAAIHLRTFVNDELRQDDTTANLIYPFARLVAYVSRFTTLHPGDLIASGTPTGAGARHDPPRYLRHGDTVRVVAEGLGELVCRVERES